MNQENKELLNKLIQENNVQDNTNNIRESKHSKLIWDDVQKILLLVQQIGYGDYNLLNQACLPHCTFLNTNYNAIYTKLLKNQIELPILYKFLDCLKSVEDGKRTQHEASYEIGLLLKSMYIDPKINTDQPMREGKNISWTKYKETTK